MFWPPRSDQGDIHPLSFCHGDIHPLSFCHGIRVNLTSAAFVLTSTCSLKPDLCMLKDIRRGNAEWSERMETKTTYDFEEKVAVDINKTERCSKEGNNLGGEVHVSCMKLLYGWGHSRWVNGEKSKDPAHPVAVLQSQCCAASKKTKPGMRNDQRVHHPVSDVYLTAARKGGQNSEPEKSSTRYVCDQLAV
jgi:hypothetical protein